MSLATIIRLEFAYQGVGILAGDSLQYLSIATAHGVIMVFFMIMPAIFGAFGNFLLPTQLGVHDVAFPRLNSAAFWFLPGGLIMLCQLVCIDRRYQRMNCFNIRELQSILKRKFFADLVSSHDHHNLMNQTILNVRFKLNQNSLYKPGIISFYNHGLLLDSTTKNFNFINSYSNLWIFENPLKSGIYTWNFVFYNQLTWLFSYLTNLNLYVKFVLDYLYFLGNTNFLGNFLIAVVDGWRLGLYVFISNFESLSVTRPLESINNLPQTKESYSFITQNFMPNNYKILHSEEGLSSIRFSSFYNPLINYDYKCGNYLTIWDKLYPSLMTSFIEVTRGIRKASWFFSDQYYDLLTQNYKNYKTYFTTSQNINFLDINSWYSSHIQPTYNFFNIFYVHSSNNFLNTRWVSFTSLNQKFYKMFNSSSTQTRILANWRQLKFTREAWRCKLLVSRHQNTLYRRFISEDNLIWAVERNAKDLLPGWAMITPFSARTRFTAIGKTDIGLMGVLIVLNASIVSSANFLVTYKYLSTLNNRKMRDARSFFTESLIVSSWMMLAANPMLVIGIIMLISDRHWQTSFFDYSGGGDTVLFQHMFWFFGHPEVYVIMVPIFGFANTILSFYLRKRVSARASLMYSMYTIAFLGFFVWGHHMYMVGLAHTTRMLFSTLTVMISIPAATKLMHWCVTIVNSFFTMEIPLLWTLTFMFFFVSGGVSGMCVAHTGMDVLFHDTFYVIGHFHVMLAGSGMMGIFSAFYFYFPALYGVRYSRIYAYIHYVYYIIGQLMTVIPMLWLGYCGMPRRVLDYPSVFAGWHSISSAGHLLSVIAILAFLIMIYDSIRQAKPTIRNNFGVGRFNNRLNFYFFEINRISFIQRKNFYMNRHVNLTTNKLQSIDYIDISRLDTTLFSYQFFKQS